MNGKIKAGFLFDIDELLCQLDENQLDKFNPSVLQYALQIYLERILFKAGEYNIVYSVAKGLSHEPLVHYLNCNLSPNHVIDIFRCNHIPSTLKCEECYVYVRNSSVLIAFY